VAGKKDAKGLQMVYVLASGEPLLMDRAVTEILDQAVPAALRGFNHEVVEGKGATAERILSAAQTLPMMATRRAVMVREVGQMAAAELAGLIAYLADPCPSTVLVATTSKIDKRLKFFAQAKKLGFLQELGAPRDVVRWIGDEAKRREVDIRPDAIRRLSDVVGADLSRLAVLLDQLALYAGGATITVEHIDDLVADTRERTVFELTDAIGAGDRVGAGRALSALIDQRQSAVGVVAMLARHMRQLTLCKAGQKAGARQGDLAKLVGAPPFVVDKLARQAGRFGDGALARATRELAWADGALKGQWQVTKTLGRGLGDRVVLERVVTALLDLGS